MIYGLYHSAAGMMTNEYRQAVLANNIANADTIGFKRDVATFAERIPARLAGRREGPSSPDLEGLSGGRWLGKTYTDHRPANKVMTGNWHDVALDGPGFLAVEGREGPLFTRDGRMLMDANGSLVAATDGAPILDRAGHAIRLNPYAQETSIDIDGRITQDGGVVAELALVDFDDYRALQKVGASRFAAPQGAGRPAPVLVQAEHLEGSGVEPLTELVDMIDASRAYQVNARMISLQDETAGRMIDAILRS